MTKLTLITVPVILCYLIFNGFPVVNSTDTTGRLKACGTVYSDLNHTGYSMSLVDKRIISDLKYYLLSTANRPGKKRKIGYEEFEKTNISETWFNQIKSVKVVPDCSLLLCDETHVKGDCQRVEYNLRELEQAGETIRVTSSVGCVCRQPNCEDQTCSTLSHQHFRNNECGRIFFEENCTTCDTAYYTIQKKNVSNIERKISETFRSIFVKPGCKFTGYLEEDFEGDEIVIESNFEKHWDFTIKSHLCVCEPIINNSTNSSASVDGEDEFSDIEMLEIPNTEAEIVSLLEKYPQHPGLLSAFKSTTNGRSPNKAYILVLGLTGSGKSATINFLFDADVAKVGGEESVTNAIHEYRIPIISKELGCSNCELRIIDTPGFGDTKGLESDAKFLAGLEQYLNSHEDLKNHIPNVVLVFAKFTDNRIKGSNSAFVKALRGIELFRDKLFDLKYSNGITVLTHFMSENNRKILRNPTSKLDLFRNIIEEYTLFPKPLRVVVAENKPELGLSPLPMLNGYYLLPNSEFYPKNLFDQIQDATKSSDPMGEGIIRTAFKDPESFKIVERTYHLYNESFDRESHFLEILNSLNYDIEKTEVSLLLAKIYNNDSLISPELKNSYKGSLQYIQRVLNLQKIISLQNVPSTKLELVKFFRNIRMNPLIQALISKALNIEIPNFGESFLVGHGYNLLEGKILQSPSSSPFSSTDLKPSEIGYNIPSETKCTVINENLDIYNTYSTFDEYLHAQVLKLTKNRGMKADLLKGTTRPSYNVKEEFLGQGNNEIVNKARKISLIREYRQFKLELNYQAKNFDSNFTKVINTIPNFNASNLNIVEQWTNFFDTYGTHVVSQAYGGGFIEVVIDCNGLPSSNAYANCQKEVDNGFGFIDELTEVGGKQIMTNKLTQNSTSNVTVRVPNPKTPKLNWKMYGGDSRFHLSELEYNRGTPGEIRHIMDAWADSLWTQSIMLDTTFEVNPITEIVKQISSEGFKKVNMAVEKLFTSALVYVPPPPPNTTTPPPPRMNVIKQDKVCLQLCSIGLEGTEPGDEEHYADIIVRTKTGRAEYYKTHIMDVTGSSWRCWETTFWVDFSDTIGISVDIKERDDWTFMFWAPDDDIDYAYFNIAQLSVSDEVRSGNIKLKKLV